MILKDVPSTFEVGSSSRGAQIKTEDDTLWKDIPCMVSHATTIGSPDYVPPSPSLEPSNSPLPEAPPVTTETDIVI